MSAASSALGAVLGYLGAEVAGISLFERLLWPERFYNAVGAVALVRLALFMPMGGPLHRAALETLDKFRDHGLYKGHRRGDMLGTTFFANNTSVHYLHKTAPTPEGRRAPRATRNGFWIEVLKHVDARIGPGGSRDSARPLPSPEDRDDVEATARGKRKGVKRQNSARTTRRIYRLHLEMLSPGAPAAGTQSMTIDESFGFRTFLGIVVSELSSILLAVASGIWLHLAKVGQDAPRGWFVGFLCIPLFLKLFAAVARVRREELTHDGDAAKFPDAETKSRSLSGSDGSNANKESGIISLADPRGVELFEIEIPSIGFLLITMPAPASPASFQFFRHYGHPIRDSAFDRTREMASMATVYAFVLYFPAGLLLLSWMNEPMQYLWLGQQLWSVLVMHLVRLFGWEGTSRTEEAMAAALARDCRVVLAGKRACAKATLQVEEVTSVSDGKKRVQGILEGL